MVELHIFDESDDLYRDAAERICAAARQAIEERGRFQFLLSGGSTPRRLYALLGSADYVGSIDWSRTHLFWGDERVVAISDPESNYRMVAETLLSRVDVPAENLHRVRTSLAPDEAASLYEQELRKYFGAVTDFDLALLGMGPDGHTASLFPGSRALGEGVRLAVPVLEKTPNRISLTLPALNASRSVMFLVTGRAKAPALAAVLEGPPDPDLPAALVRPESGNLQWLVDRAAASLLRQRSSHAQ